MPEAQQRLAVGVLHREPVDVQAQREGVEAHVADLVVPCVLDLQVLVQSAPGERRYQPEAGQRVQRREDAGADQQLARQGQSWHRHQCSFTAPMIGDGEAGRKARARPARSIA